MAWLQNSLQMDSEFSIFYTVGGGCSFECAPDERGAAKCVLGSARGEGGSKKAEKLRAYLMYGPYEYLLETYPSYIRLT